MSRTPASSAPWFACLIGLAAALIPLAAGTARANEDFPFPRDRERLITAEQHLCGVIEAAARQHALPVAFFTRLLWQESGFRPGAVSPKGAQGIAQFMPGTAQGRGLVDPFDPLAAIPASAHLLGDLKAQFGNLGLAAAAYNAGSARVADWIAGTSSLPSETQDYVLSITGEPVQSWMATEAAHPAAAEEADCLQLAGRLRTSPAAASPSPNVPTGSGPWGVQVAGNYSRARVLADYAELQRRFPAIVGGKPPMVVRTRLGGRGMRMFYRVRVPAQSREEATRICGRLKDAGGPCIILKT